MTKRQLISWVRSLGGSREVTADVERLYGFAVRQPYLSRRRATWALAAYGGARARADELTAGGKVKLAAAALRSAGVALDGVGLTPESRRHAIAQAKRRRLAEG